MKYLKLGNELMSSAIALGCMRMAGIDDDAAENIISSALELGINYFDHADIYGDGLSEEKFGKYLRTHPADRDRMIVQTKCAIHDGQYDFSKSYILKQVDGSLARLNADIIDALLLHRPDTLMEPDEVAEAFSALESAGKVRRFGVSNFNPWQIELLKTAVKQPLIIDQLQFSVTEAGMITSGMNVNMKNADGIVRDGGILEYCRINKITIQAWSPLMYGFFEGFFVGNREKFPELNDELDALALKYGVTPTAIAIAWILRHPAGIQAIVGTMNPVHLKELCAAADIELTRAEWYAIYRSAGHTLP